VTVFTVFTLMKWAVMGYQLRMTQCLLKLESFKLLKQIILYTT